MYVGTVGIVYLCLKVDGHVSMQLDYSDDAFRKIINLEFYIARSSNSNCISIELVGIIEITVILFFY